MTTPNIAATLVARGMSEREAAAKEELYARCAAALGEQASEAERAAFFVPGRIEILGKHTDYAGGRSLLCAIERGFVVAVAAREDAVVRVSDVQSGETREFTLEPDLEVVRGGGANYVSVVVRRIARNFANARRGANIAFASDLPQAAGLSSSSALIVSIFLALDAVNAIGKDPLYRANIDSPEALAAYLAAIENGQSFGQLSGDRGVGTFGGSEDHVAILWSRPGFVSLYAFSPVREENEIPFPPSHALVVAHSGVSAGKTGSAQIAYNEAALAVQRILEIWNTGTGREDKSLADAINSKRSAASHIRDLLTRSTPRDFTPERLIERFDHFQLEAFELVPRGAEALAGIDLQKFGETVDSSQQAAEHMLRNQTQETNALARLAREAGAVAASAFGAGFGGSVWAMVAADDAERFAETWRASYARDFPAAAAQAHFIVTRPGPGATAL